MNYCWVWGSQRCRYIAKHLQTLHNNRACTYKTSTTMYISWIGGIGCQARKLLIQLWKSIIANHTWRLIPFLFACAFNYSWAWCWDHHIGWHCIYFWRYLSLYRAWFQYSFIPFNTEKLCSSMAWFSLFDWIRSLQDSKDHRIDIY